MTHAEHCPTCGREIKRTLDQNGKFQAMCREVARQVEWHGMWLSENDWRAMFASIIFKQRIVPGPEGGFVVLGGSTRDFSKKEASDLIELIYAFGAEHNVTFKEPKSEESVSS